MHDSFFSVQWCVITIFFLTHTHTHSCTVKMCIHPCKLMDNMLSCGGTLRWLNAFLRSLLLVKSPLLMHPRGFSPHWRCHRQETLAARHSRGQGWGWVSKQSHCKGLKQIRVLFVCVSFSFFFFFKSDWLNELLELQSCLIIGPHDQRMCLSQTENFKNNNNKQFRDCKWSLVCPDSYLESVASSSHLS